MKEPKRYDFRQDGYTLQVLQTDSKYNKDKILKYLICKHNIFIVHLVFPLSYPNFVKIRFFTIIR
jgi:hypothetical protein